MKPHLLLPLFILAGLLVTASEGRADWPDRRGPLRVTCLDAGIYHGAAPTTRAHFDKLRALGIRRIVDVRSFKRFEANRERRLAAQYGITYVRIPTGFFPTRFGSAPAVLANIKSHGCGSVYFHCNLGSDRVGMLVAIYRVEELGWAPQAAWNCWKTDQFNPALKDLDRFFWQRVGGCNKGPLTPCQSEPR